MKKTLYATMLFVVLILISTAVTATAEEVPDNDYFDFNGAEDIFVAPRVVDKATGEVLIEELLLAQVIGGGVVIMTYAVNGEFQETEMSWKEIKILTPDNQECSIPDLQHVHCPGLEKWNKNIEEIVQ